MHILPYVRHPEYEVFEILVCPVSSTLTNMLLDPMLQDRSYIRHLDNLIILYFRD